MIVTAPDQEIDVARITDGVFVNPRDPLGDSVATGDGVRYAGCIEGPHDSTQALFDLFSRHERPLPTDGLDCCFCHDKRSL
jgi:hypothetical protein